MTPEKRFLTTGAVAQYCTVSHLTVTNWIRAGKLLASRTPGGHNRIRREDLLKFLLEHHFPVPPELSRVAAQILVVDDERPLAEVMAHALTEDGYQVSVAFDGYEAGVKMATLQPDLLILDLIMPGLDGFSICRRIKSNVAGAPAKIIAMTGFVQEGNLAKALECGADVCLAKPFQLDTLRRMVAQLLGNTRGLPSSELGRERRRSLRMAAEFPVMCTPISAASAPDITPRRGKTLNVSREGVLLRLNGPVEPFTLWSIQVALGPNREPLQAVAESRWVRPGVGGKSHSIGFAFVGMSHPIDERWATEIYAATLAHTPQAIGSARRHAARRRCAEATLGKDGCDAGQSDLPLGG